MNADQLKKRLGQPLRLRPLPQRIDPNGNDLGPLDDDWILADVKNKPKGVVLRNIHTGHVVDLQADNVKEFRSPHYLILRCLLVIQGMKITIEPIVRP